MKNSRSIFWMVALIIMVLAAHALLSYKGGAERALVRRSVLSGISPDRIVSVRIRRPGSPDATLARINGWRLVDPYASYADERVVMKLIDALASSEIEESLSGSELFRLGRSRDDLGLEPPRLSLSVAGQGDDGEEELSFGSATPDGKGVYACVSGDDSVFVVSSNLCAAANLSADDIRCRSLFKATPELVQSFDIKSASGPFMRFQRDHDAWSMVEPGEASASATRIRELLNAVFSANAGEFAWPVGAEGEGATASAALLASYGLEAESALTLTMKCADGKDRQISFGKSAKGGGVWALCQNAGAIAVVDAKLKELASAGVAGFTDSRLFPYEEANLSLVSIVDGDAQYLLAKGETGEWRLDSPVVAATDAESVDMLLDNLLALTAGSADEAGLLVSVNTNSSPVRVSAKSLLGKMRLADLRSREMLKIDPAQARRMVATPAGGAKPTSVVYDRDRGEWLVENSPVPGTVDMANVEKILSVIKSLRAARIVHLKVGTAELRRYSLDNPRLVFAVDLAKKDGARRNILVGDKCEGGYYATLGASDAVFVLGADEMAALFAPLVKE